jgi:hypothetical protein
MNNFFSTKLYLTLHSFGQAVLIPWGHSATLPSDYGDMLALAKSATSTFQHYKFKVGNVAALFYRASGTLVIDRFSQGFSD